jgi:hypothetical protein
VDLLVAILRGTPRLQGALCRAYPDLFDATHPIERGQSLKGSADARAAAIRICQTCPALDPCGAWLDNLRPAHRPSGVVAGQISQPRLYP